MVLNGPLKDFMDSRHPRIATYVFYRPEFFVDRLIIAIKQLVQKFPELGLVVLGSPEVPEEVQQQVKKMDLEPYIFFAGDQSHDAFLTILSQCDFYLRTPVKDGICSSVLEALSLGVPVVASENNRRPASVITYDNSHPESMVKVIEEVVPNLNEIKKQIKKPYIKDTVQDEITLLTED
ncbi:MAG: hypothetical protein Kow0042_25440 [Calditrichia bacterium]